MIRNATSCASGMSITSSNRNLSSNVNFLSVFKISSFIVSLLALCCKWIYKNDGFFVDVLATGIKNTKKEVHTCVAV